MRKPTRREFLRAALGASVALPVASGFGGGQTNQRTTAPDLWGLGFPDPAVGWRGDSSVAAALRAGQSLQSFSAPFPQVEAKPATSLRECFADLDRHFIFDYYPWYGADPWRHWDNQDRFPPDDIAATSVPHLGPYDSKSTAVLERHARWIAESSVGAIALSWWGRGSYEDAAVPLVMDVMKAHDIKVTFGLEPYANDRGSRYAQDILYLLREFGEKRGWDAFLVLKNEDGEEGPVFKGFRLILPRGDRRLSRHHTSGTGFHAGRGLAASDRRPSEDSQARLRSHHASRGLARFRQDPRVGLRRCCHLRQFHRAGSLRRVRCRCFAARPPLLFQHEPRFRWYRAATRRSR